MSQPRQPDQVTALRRPPVRQSTMVRSDPRHTFETFVRTIGAWWPAVPFSAGQDQVRDVTVEQRPGGRVYETWADGTELDWGELLAWEPPERFIMTWTGTPVPTEVEFSFAGLGPALTRVTVEHRGWEAMTDEQLAAGLRAARRLRLRCLLRRLDPHPGPFRRRDGQRRPVRQ